MKRHQSSDAFNHAIEEYIETIRSEGQRAISLATNRISAELNKRFDQESHNLKECLIDRDRVIANLESEVESRKELCSRLTKQLRSVASVAGKRGEYSGLWQSHQGIEVVLSAWLRNAEKKYREERGNRIASSLYTSKLCGRSYHSWHLLTVTEQMGRLHSEEIRLKEDSIHRMALERDRAREEVKRLISELDFERGKRADFISKIKSTFSNKLDTLLTDN